MRARDPIAKLREKASCDVYPPALLSQGRERARRARTVRLGGVPERPNGPVLKTGDGATHPRVQISPPPPSCARVFVIHLRP